MLQQTLRNLTICPTHCAALRKVVSKKSVCLPGTHSFGEEEDLLMKNYISLSDNTEHHHMIASKPDEQDLHL